MSARKHETRTYADTKEEFETHDARCRAIRFKSRRKGKIRGGVELVEKGYSSIFMEEKGIA